MIYIIDIIYNLLYRQGREHAAVRLALSAVDETVATLNESTARRTYNILYNITYYSTLYNIYITIYLVICIIYLAVDESNIRSTSPPPGGIYIQCKIL